MRKALVVGIDYYSGAPCLHGCVNDAYSVKSVLERNSDGTINFSTRLISGTGPTDLVTRCELRESIKSLFSGDEDTVLFYFAGHGHIESTGGYILACDSRTGDDGISLSDVVAYANASRSKNRIIILDSCHSGVVGSSALSPSVSEIKEGLTILTASTAEQYASEQNGAGVFTTLLVDALNGAAGNLIGDVTPGSVYAHIDQSLGPWDQRPVFKTNVKTFVSLRKVQPPISLSDLQRLTEFFPQPGYVFNLDPSYEPERAAGAADTIPPDPNNVVKFLILQKLNRVNLVVPVGAPHMWHSAMESKGCRLTVLGEHYRRLVSRGMI